MDIERPVERSLAGMFLLEIQTPLYPTKRVTLLNYRLLPYREVSDFRTYHEEENSEDL